jgi:hypothetical protein
MQRRRCRDVTSDGGSEAMLNGTRNHAARRALAAAMILSVTACARATSPAASPAAQGGAAGEAATAPQAGAMAPEPAGPYAMWPDTLAQLPRGPQQTAAVCARSVDNAIKRLFCGDAPPAITSLVDLENALELGSAYIKDTSQITQGDFAALSITGHSTALSTRAVSAINPRVIAMQLSLPLIMTVVAFTRGEQLVEIIASDEMARTLQFYILGFRQACNAAPGGCTFGDLQTPAVESGWTETTLYDETDLANTVLDCAPCHQPGGPGTTKFMRMQEFDMPWTHWFSQKDEGGMALLSDYMAAKGDEPLAGFPLEQIMKADPLAITTLVTLTRAMQPNTFHSALVEKEVKESAAALGGNQPFDNSIPGMSPTWTMNYEKAIRGSAISVPYHDVKITDPAKLAKATAAYQAYRNGTMAAAALPDLRDVFPDDAMRLSEMGVGTDPRLDGPALLIQTCSQCHNSSLDQSLTRARFRPDLAAMSREEKDVAIARMMLPPSDPLAMPPLRLRVMTRAARQLAIDALRQ